MNPPFTYENVGGGGGGKRQETNIRAAKIQKDLRKSKGGGRIGF